MFNSSRMRAGFIRPVAVFDLLYAIRAHFHSVCTHVLKQVHMLVHIVYSNSVTGSVCRDVPYVLFLCIVCVCTSLYNVVLFCTQIVLMFLFYAKDDI